MKTQGVDESWLRGVQTTWTRLLEQLLAVSGRTARGIGPSLKSGREYARRCHYRRRLKRLRTRGGSNAENIAPVPWYCPACFCAHDSAEERDVVWAWRMQLRREL